MTPERLTEIRERSFTTTPLEGNLGFCGLSADEAQELLVEVSRHEAAMAGKEAQSKTLLDDIHKLMQTARDLRALVDFERERVTRIEKERMRLVDKHNRLVTWLNRHKIEGWQSSVED